MNPDTLLRLLVSISDGVKCLVTEVNVVAARSAGIFFTLARVARIVLWTGISDCHYYACTIAAAVTAVIVNTCDFVAIATHCPGARWAS